MDDCPICLQQSVATCTTPCNHNFCADCLIKQANTEINGLRMMLCCGLCRTPFDPVRLLFARPEIRLRSLNPTKLLEKEALADRGIYSPDLLHYYFMRRLGRVGLYR